MAESTMADEDPFLPVRITHNSEQIWTDNKLAQNYNYLVYEFETEQHRYRARAYLDRIRAVAVYGPFEKDPAKPAPLEGLEIDQRVLTYLRRRYMELTRLGPSGYVPIK